MNCIVTLNLLCMQELFYSVDGVGTHGTCLTLLQLLTPLQLTHTLSKHSHISGSSGHGVKVLPKVFVQPNSADETIIFILQN